MLQCKRESSACLTDSSWVALSMSPTPSDMDRLADGSGGTAGSSTLGSPNLRFADTARSL